MFKDYYQILELEFGASPLEIKAAYKRFAKKWHPDLNREIDAHEIMQAINEAFLILNDPEAKLKYDQEYLHFRQFSESDAGSDSSKNNYKEYQFQDEILKKWMSNARAQARILATQSLEKFGEGVSAAGKEMASQTVYFIILGVIFMFVFLIAKTC